MLLCKVDAKFGHKSHRDIQEKSIIKPVHLLAGKKASYIVHPRR